MQRQEFVINEILINGLKIKRVIVDDHAYKHPDVTDDLILDLVRQLDGIEQRPDDVKGPYEILYEPLGGW